MPTPKPTPDLATLAGEDALAAADAEAGGHPLVTCCICGTPAGGIFSSWNRCCSNPENLQEW